MDVVELSLDNNMRQSLVNAVMKFNKMQGFLICKEFD
jgi:hypothetical protein